MSSMPTGTLVKTVEALGNVPRLVWLPVALICSFVVLNFVELGGSSILETWPYFVGLFVCQLAALLAGAALMKGPVGWPQVGQAWVISLLLWLIVFPLAGLLFGHGDPDPGMLIYANTLLEALLSIVAIMYLPVSFLGIYAAVGYLHLKVRKWRLAAYVFTCAAVTVGTAFAMGAVFLATMAGDC